MSRFARTVVLAAIFAPAAGVQAAPVVAVLRSHVTVGSAQVELGDVAELGGEERARVALGHVVVGHAPRVDYVQRFTPAMIDAAIRKAGLRADVVWQGSPAVQVASASQKVAGADITRAVSTALSAADPHGDYVFNIAHQVEPVDIPARAFSLHVRSIERTTFGTRIGVWVDVVVDGDVYRSVQVPVDVVREKPVLVAHTDLRAGTVVGSAQFDTMRRNIAGTSQRVLDQLPVDSRVRLARPMRAGELLTADKLVANDAVVSGDHVHVVARAGVAAVEMDGVVVRGGASGQVVEVQVAHSAQALSGTLLDNHTVAIQ